MLSSPDKPSEWLRPPKVSKFKASQSLINPNKASKNDQQGINIVQHVATYSTQGVRQKQPNAYHGTLN
uniref:Uncharacterized protein n=1 Tax=Panagrolaimus sp. PS1159 TaxID=55785 RepID=A0AC35GEJ2_9BILA